MPHYVGLDAGKHATSICIVNEDGEIVKEGSVETEPANIIAFLRGGRRRYRRIGIEAMSLAGWLYQHLAKAGLPIICIDALKAHAVLKTRRNKTDRNDARGIAELMRMGGYKAVHVKTDASRDTRAILTTRRLLCEKRRDVDNLIRGLLLQLGQKLNAGQPSTFVARAEKLVAKAPALAEPVAALLAVRAVIIAGIVELETTLNKRLEADPVCRRLMTAPGIGPIAALTYRAAIDLPERFARSRDVGVHVGLTRRTYKSGTIERSGRISKCGDATVRMTLFLSAKALLSRRTRPSALQAWGRGIVERRGYLKGAIAVARRLAVLLHAMWRSETDFQWEAAA
jgi:transposase